MYKKVMVIDDNEVDLYISKRVMEKSTFAKEVILMESAIDAIAYFKENVYKVERLLSLIFLDINMPEMNGFEFLDAYNKLPETIKQSCIIMMLTTSVHSEDKERADSNPYVRNYLNKPLSVDKLKLLNKKMTYDIKRKKVPLGGNGIPIYIVDGSNMDRHISFPYFVT